MAEGGGTALIHGLPLWANIILSGVTLFNFPWQALCSFGNVYDAVAHV